MGIREGFHGTSAGCSKTRKKMRIGEDEEVT
jgi:hypothetical protein